MKKLWLPVVLPLCFLCFTLSGCTGAKEAEPEKGSIEKLTEQTGREAAEAIKKTVKITNDTNVNVKYLFIVIKFF